MSRDEPKSYVHRGGDEPLIGETIDAYLHRVVERFGHRDALVSIPQAVRLSYAAMDERVERLARGLMGLGVERGDRVGIWSTNNAEWVLVQLAAARLGAVLVNVSPACSIQELHHCLRLARVQVLFVTPGSESRRPVEMLGELCPETSDHAADEFRSALLPDLERLVVFDPADAAATARPAPGFHTWSDLLELGRRITPGAVAARADSLDPDDAINIQFTSGTTGHPKAVVLTHHNILNNAYFTGAALQFTEDDRLCVPVPFHHCFGMVVATLMCFTRGAALVIPGDRFEAGATLAAIERERCTAVHGVPTMFVAELEQMDRRSFDLSSLRTGIMGGAPCPPALVRRVIDELGCTDLRIGYGQTEASPITHLTRADDPLAERQRTVGTNLPYQETKVVDPSTGRIVPLGEVGEVCFRGYHVMRGYFEQPEATAEVIDRAGWLRSGDLGVLDEDGRLRITGRLRDLIIRGGENIYPAVVEACYAEHPQVAEVAVFGVPDPRYGEQVAAWIRLHHGQTVSPEALRAYGAERLAHHEVPSHVWIVDALPRTATGKVQKFRIRETVAGWLGEPGAPWSGPARYAAATRSACTQPS